MHKNIKMFLILLAIFLIALLALVIYLVRTNTSFLTFNISDDELSKNNTNDDLEDSNGNNNANSDESNKYINLVESKVIVPDELKDEFPEERTLNIPEGFEISVYATGLGSARHMVFAEGNDIYLADKDGNIWLIKDNFSKDYSTEKILVDTGLLNPHGIDIYSDDLYVGEEHQVIVYRDIKSNGTYSKKEVLIPNLPTGGHVTRTVLIGPDQKLYVSIGSSCNLCEEDDKRRAAIVRYNLGGTNEEIFAEGLRNSVGITFGPEGELWSVDNGRDLLGDNLPPEEVNIVEEGKHYGWPYCYGSGNANPEYEERADFCSNESVFPKYEMQAHSAPLGILYVFQRPEGSDVFRLGDFLPEEFNHNIIIPFHGSWNRSTPTGYKVVRINTDEEKDNEGVVIDFVTGWLEGNANAWGRPVDVKLGFDSALYISDDQQGVIYRLSYEED